MSKKCEIQFDPKRHQTGARYVDTSRKKMSQRFRTSKWARLVVQTTWADVSLRWARKGREMEIRNGNLRQCAGWQCRALYHAYRFVSPSVEAQRSWRTITRKNYYLVLQYKMSAWRSPWTRQIQQSLAGECLFHRKKIKYLCMHLAKTTDDRWSAVLSRWRPLCFRLTLFKDANSSRGPSQMLKCKS